MSTWDELLMEQARDNAIAERDASRAELEALKALVREYFAILDAKFAIYAPGHRVWDAEAFRADEAALREAVKEKQ